MKLRLYLTAQWQDAASPCLWVLRDDAGNVRDCGHGPLASLPQASLAEVILAADRVLALAVLLPAIRRSKLEAALPFLIEESLIEDAAAVHVVPGARLADGRTVLYAVNKDWLSRFLAAARTARLRIQRAVPEFCLLPLKEGEWSLGCSKSHCFLAMPGGLGGILDGEHPGMSAALQLYLQQTRPTALRIFLLDDAFLPPDWNPGLPVVVEKTGFDWRRAWIPPEAPNLLWGPFAPPARIEALWPWLRPLLMAGLLALGVEILFTHLEWAYWAWEKRQLTQQINQTFRETFGAEAAIVNAPLQMRRHIARLRHGAGLDDEADFLPLLEKFAAAASSLSGHTLRTLHYEEGRLSVEMTLPHAAALDTLRQRLTASGLAMRVTDRQDSGNALSVQLRISPGGAS